MGLPLFKTPMKDKPLTEGVAVGMRDTPRVPAVRPSSETQIALEILRRSRQNRPLTHDRSFTQPATVSLDAPSRPAREYAPSSRSSSPDNFHQAQEISQTQNTWGPIDARPRNAISGTDYVERRLREAVGHEVNRLSSRLYTQTGGSAVEEDRQVMREAERMIEQVRQDLRRVVDERMGSIVRPGWTGDTSTPAVTETSSHEQWRPVRLVRSELFIPPNGPGTATVVNRDIPGSYSRLRPSPASTAQVVANIEPLSITVSSIPVPHHVDRAATPPIRSAAPSPPAIAGHVRGRHSPPT